MDNVSSQVDYSSEATTTNKFTLNKDQQVVYGLGKLGLKNKEFLHWLLIFLSAKTK